MRKKPIPERQSKLTLFALEHWVLLAIASGVVVFLWTMVVVGDWPAGAGAGGGLAIVVGYLWSPLGWARRREQRLYDENGDGGEVFVGTSRPERAMSDDVQRRAAITAELRWPYVMEDVSVALPYSVTVQDPDGQLWSLQAPGAP